LIFNDSNYVFFEVDSEIDDWLRSLILWHATDDAECMGVVEHELEDIGLKV
jgi:hypothetical protein